MMTPRLTKFALTAHISFSVGWLGAVAAFLVLAIVGLTSPDPQKVRAAYLAMDVTGWYVIVPLCFASLLSGLVQSLGTTWGLFQHYWVLAKLLITVLATILLLVHMRAITSVTSEASGMTLSTGDPGGRVHIVSDAGAAVLALLVATVLSVYKPQGRTPYGRKQYEQRLGSGRESSAGTPRWVYAFGIIAMVLLFAAQHLTHGGLHGHGH